MTSQIELSPAYKKSESFLLSLWFVGSRYQSTGYTSSTVFSLNGVKMGLLREALNRLRTLLNRTSGQKSQPYPDQDNETPVAADGGNVSVSEARKEINTRKRKRFWRWHSRRKKYCVAKAEKLYQTSVSETGTYRTHNQGKVELN